ncbi:hypothetical protein LJB89_03085 [Tyzzerella sp. OttesenSCG-928-J15]|nr:hypothetical protein [Tyzzerella sp. OttesenSCG-928-J15]
MKKYGLIYFTLILISFLSLSAYGATEEGYKKCAEYKVGRLSIISYCEAWGEDDLKEIYTELVSNTTGPEFPYLKAIFIYPDYPYGENVSGNYFEDIKESQKGRYLLGGNCQIELYGGLDKQRVEELAPALSHEYGHHFTIFNMMVYEKNHYSGWAKSEYATLRNLDEQPVIYSYKNAEIYSRNWDVLEIAANDYVQLLGSTLAKKSYRYLDAKQFVELGSEGIRYNELHFNSRPQENLELPLAAQVEGLYEYFLKISKNEELALEKAPYINTLPKTIEIEEHEAFINKTYNLRFEKATGNGPFEYTILLYPKELGDIPAIIKTLNDGQPLEATFGTLLEELPGGAYLPVLDYYGGMCQIIIYAKDSNDFIYASPAFNYDFGDDYFDLKNYLTDSN